MFPFRVEYFQTGQWAVMRTGNLRVAMNFLKYCYAGVCLHGHDPTLFIHRHRSDGYKAFHCAGDGVERCDRREKLRAEDEPPFAQKAKSAVV